MYSQSQVLTGIAQQPRTVIDCSPNPLQNVEHNHREATRVKNKVNYADSMLRASHGLSHQLRFYDNGNIQQRVGLGIRAQNIPSNYIGVSHIVDRDVEDLSATITGGLSRINNSTCKLDPSEILRPPPNPTKFSG